MRNSKIEWTVHGFNPWLGCQHVSPGCEHCYAEAWAKRFKMVQWGPHSERRRTTDGYWRGPLKYNADADQFEAKHGHRQRVFCAPNADVFDNKVPKQWRHDL
jgi:protein gp37